MRRHPDVFSFFRQPGPVGELTGQLENVFLRLYTTSSSRRKSARRSAAVRCPIFVLCAMARRS
jgi:hypothetical protein